MLQKERTRRLFFALWPDEATRAALSHATRKAVHASGGKPVPIENFHVTLAFLGSIRESRLGTVIDAVEELSFEPLQIAFDRIEHWAKSAVLCATPSTRAVAVADFVDAMVDSLAQHGQPSDPQPWRAHVTLARSVTHPHHTGAIAPVQWRAERFALVESQTLPSGSRYTVLQEWPG